MLVATLKVIFILAVFRGRWWRMRLWGGEGKGKAGSGDVEKLSVGESLSKYGSDDGGGERSRLQTS